MKLQIHNLLNPRIYVISLVHIHIRIISPAFQGNCHFGDISQMTNLISARPNHDNHVHEGECNRLMKDTLFRPVARGGPMVPGHPPPFGHTLPTFNPES